MKRQDWPELLAAYTRTRPADVSDAQWVADWLALCDGTQGDEVDPRLAQRGFIVQMPSGLAICVGLYAAGPGALLMPMSDALTAWRVD